ncbi:hypothetical protein QQS21_008895 [Conoideocrella luteorostrata]|uniref:Uncharacterized protein n=1 Tax=Conoideocrella luteorostrata TaxID=1105319 RepID=A0AAJ0CKQ8_9HYPO|nr:hypothetical protein QQS21_008895 [Conoideocrella luteorostrata]
MAAETSSPAREPPTAPTRGRGRGGRGGRGRGRGGGRGASNAAVSKSTPASRGRGGTRRGRVKNFSDSRVQAAYERQRDLKATYQAVAFALKPALQELAERTVDDMLQKPDSHKQAKEYMPIVEELADRLDNRLRECDRRFDCDMNLAKHSFSAEKYVTEKEFQNGVSDILEQFYEGQENRLRILAALHSKDLPVDVRDDQYEYRVISDACLDNEFGIYECYKNGHLVPYPSRVIGTEMWRKYREAEATAPAPRESSAAPTPPTRGRGRGRGAGASAGIKRRALDQLDGQTTPKRSTRNMDDSQLLAPTPRAPAPMKGLLASAANVDDDPEAANGEEESVPASPEPPSLNGGTSFTSRAHSRQLAREKSPQLPKNIGEPDEYGIRSYMQRPSMRAMGINSRILAPRPFTFEDWEIGFRDSSNDASKGHTRAKRGKYLDTPNSNGIHYDLWCNGYDYSTTKPEDFDQKLVKKYGVHPTYGIFLPSSSNEPEPPNPYTMPGKPNLFIANPTGRISHGSRSFQSTTNERRSEEQPIRMKMKANLHRFCKLSDIDVEDVSIAEYVETDDELRSKSLGTAEKEFSSRPQFSETSSEVDEVESTPQEQPEQPDGGGLSAMSVLTYASAYVAAQEVIRAAPPTPKPARYDAIRDVFTDSKPDPPPAPESNIGLNFLAELCNVESRLPGSSGEEEPTPSSAAPIPAEPEVRTNIKREELPPVTSFNHGSINSRLSSQEPPPLYMHGQADRLPPPPSGHIHDRQGYPVPAATPQQDYKSSVLPPGPPHQDHGGYYRPPPIHSSAYPPDPRPIDPAYNPRRQSNYGVEASQQPAYGRMYWPTQSSPPGPAGAAVPSAHQVYHPPPPPSSSRISFSRGVSSEPLPPLRPPRGRTQSGPEEPPYDPNIRGSLHNSYYPPPSQPYHRGYPVLETHQPPSLQSMAGDRILPNPQQGNPPYMGSPPPAGYMPQILSPTFGGAPGLPGSMMQSPPGTPHGGPPGSAHRHRSTLSGSSDAGSNKYRKLQPAPVPAHRAWSNKPELKTIPYDHKETGSSAALPSSGPTLIRGWNVNQHRKRSRHEKHPDRTTVTKITTDQPNYKSIKFITPMTLPPLCPRKGMVHPQRPEVKMVVAKMPDEPLELENVSMYGFGAIPNLEASESSEAPLKRRLRPRKEKKREATSDAEVVILDIKSQPQRPKSSVAKSSSRARASSSRTNKRVLKPKPGDKSLPIEIMDGEKMSIASGHRATK